MTCRASIATGLITALLSGALPAQAARPLITDDARLVDAYACQVESWIRNNRDSREYWALPSCNVTGNLEVTLGGARTSEDTGGSATTDIVLQGKTLFKRLETNGYGIGLAVGYAARPEVYPGKPPLGNPYFYVPASFSFNNDRFVLHTNVGALHARDQSRLRGTWGIGSETELTPRIYLVAETYGESGSTASYQAGIRYWVVPNHVQIDATYGKRYGNHVDGHWVSVGLRLLSVPFLR